MKEINIDLALNNIVDQLGNALNGIITNSYNEHVLNFDNTIGNGVIRNINFYGGISLLNYDVCFNEDVKIVFKLSQNNPLEFLYISNGCLNYASKRTENQDLFVKFNRYQNIVLSNLPNAYNVYVFPSGASVKLNVISIDSAEFFNPYINSWQDSLRQILKGQQQDLPYLHLGNFSLNLANTIEQMHVISDEGICKFLNIEGQLKRLLALQILEHKNYENKISLPSSMSNTDLLKTKAVSKYITDNLQDVYTVADLAAMHSFSPRKMQAGFQVLNGMTVNEFVRQKKLEYAMDLIKTSDYSISEIVYQIGYRSRSYFSKIFFEAFNILPIDYRDLIKSNQVISK